MARAVETILVAPSNVGDQESNIEEAMPNIEKTPQVLTPNIEEDASSIEKTNTEKEVMSNIEKTPQVLAPNSDTTATTAVSKEMPNTISQAEEILLPFVSNIEEIKNALALLMDDETPEQPTPENMESLTFVSNVGENANILAPMPSTKVQQIIVTNNKISTTVLESLNNVDTETKLVKQPEPGRKMATAESDKPVEKINTKFSKLAPEAATEKSKENFASFEAVPQPVAAFVEVENTELLPKPSNPVTEEKVANKASKQTHNEAQSGVVETSKVNNKRKLLESIASKLALNESESKAGSPPKKVENIGPVKQNENIGPIKQKSDLLKERFTDIVRNPTNTQTNPQKAFEPNPEAKKSDLLQFWNPQDKIFDSGVIEAMLGLSKVGNLGSLATPENKALDPKTNSSKNVIESVFPEKAELNKAQQRQKSNEVVQERPKSNGMEEKSANPTRAEWHWQYSAGQALMVTHGPMASTVERGVSGVDMDRSQMDTSSSMDSSPMGYPMDAFLNITLKEEGAEQQESLQVKTLRNGL